MISLMWNWLTRLRLPRWTTRTVEVLCDGEVVACYALTFLGVPEDEIWISEALEEATLDRNVPRLTGSVTCRIREVREGDTEA
jgi:hypothetical protein